MTAGGRVVELAVAALAVACALLAARVAERAAPLRAELGRARLATVDAATRARLAALEQPVDLTWYRTPPARMPAQLAPLEEGVRAALSALADASEGRVRARVIDPEERPEMAEALAAMGVAPWRARAVERDGWSETRVWSSLAVACGPRATAVTNGLGLEHLPQLQRFVLEQVEELLAPRAPRVALDAPDGYERFAARLAREAELTRVDLAAGDALPDDAELFVWLAPRAAGARELAALDRFLARGGSALVAGSAFEARAAFGLPGLVELEPTGFDAPALLAHYGLRALDGLLLDARASSAATADTARAAPHELACLAPEQDFRAMRGQPNGALLFATPTAFEPDAARLAELGLELHALGAARAGAVLAPVPEGQVPAAALASLPGEPAPRAALMALLAPSDPWRGSLVVLGAASPFADGRFEDERYAHEALAEILRRSLVGPERRVAARIARAQPAPLAQLDSGRRLAWRLFVVALPPALVLALFALRRRRVALPRLPRAVAGALAPAAAAALAALLVARLLPAASIDLSAGGARSLRAEERAALAALVEAAGGELVLESWFSAPASLPPELRPLAREARALGDELARALPGLRHVAREVDELDEATRRELGALGIAPRAARSGREEETRVRQVVAALRLARGDEARVVELAEPHDAQTLPFRVAFALWRLATGREARLALAAEPPRLTPAEAALEYQQKGLFPPQEGDVYSGLRAHLERAGFAVTALDPAAEAPIDAELLVWVQPRRDSSPTMARAAELLARGGRVLVAAQHFQVRARQLERGGLALAFWPEPQFTDLERHYLPALGIELVREVLFDRVFAPMEVETRLDRPGGGAEYARQESAQPFLIRAPEAQFAREVDALRGLGELALPSASRLRWDEAELARRGLEVEPWLFTSQEAWSFAWEGGDLPASVLEGPGEAGALSGPQPLAARFRGRFPGAERVVAEERPTIELRAPGETPGELVLVGCSEMWRDELLSDARFQNARFALAAAAELTLPAELARFLQRRAAAPGLGYVAPERRLFWRALVIGSAPLAVLLLGLARRLRG